MQPTFDSWLGTGTPRLFQTCGSWVSAVELSPLSSRLAMVLGLGCRGSFSVFRLVPRSAAVDAGE